MEKVHLYDFIIGNFFLSLRRKEHRFKECPVGAEYL